MKHLILQKASAGSGKTYQLALNYIRMTLGETDRETGQLKLFYPRARNRHRDTLAVTFTNKATEEMKQRIIKELAQLADPEAESNYRPTLIKDFRTDGATLAKAAAMALNDVLFDYGHFHVSTIDAFFQTVLRSFAYEADLSGNYDLELEDSVITEQAINDIIGVATGTVKAPEKNARLLRSWIRSYISDLRDKSKSFDLLNPDNNSRELLMEFVANLSDENYKTNREAIDRFTNNPDAVNTLHLRLREKAASLCDEIRSVAGTLFSNHSSLLDRKPKNFVEKAQAWPIEEPGLTTNYKVILNDPDAALSFLKAKAKANPAEAAEAMALCRKLTGLIRDWASAKVMIDQIHNYGLFSEVLKYAERHKIETNTIMLSDTNTLLNRIIDGSPSPFIYERIGRRLRHFLIDEFQDTSRLQWSNLKPLLQESLSEGNDNLIIGDVKQCIYRFRNSDPHLLDSELESDPEICDHIKPEPHNMNFRSAADVVNFNNRLFELLSHTLGKHDVYSTVAQTPRSDAPGGYVSIAAPGEDSDGLTNMLNNIVRQLDPNQGGYRPGDIAVLVRTRKEGEEVVNFLIQQTVAGAPLEGVNILSDEALFVSSSKAVQHIILQLRQLSTPGQANQSESAAYSTSELEMNRINDRLHELTAGGMEPSEALAKVIEELHESTSEAREADPDRLRDLCGRSLFEIVEGMIRTLPIDAWRESEALYLCAFQDLVSDFCRGSNPTVYDFLEFWDGPGQKAAVGLSGEVNAIQVMTIHKSKGLEFDCVHLPLMPKQICKEKGFRWYDAHKAFASLNLPCETPEYFSLTSTGELLRTHFSAEYESLLDESKLDELNSLYVAFTRARRELCVTLNPTDRDDTCTTTLIREALSQMTSQALPAGQQWEVAFGEPTKAPASKDSKDNESSIITIGDYHIYDREDTWTFTEIDTEEEPFNGI